MFEKTLTEQLRDEAQDVIFQRAQIALGRRYLFWQANALAPTFYREDRQHLVDLCNTLQAFYQGELINPATNTPYKKLLLEMPPQHGKSRTLQQFCAFAYSQDVAEQIIYASYNDVVAGQFSKFTRDLISKPREQHELIYRDIYPDVEVARGSSGIQKWALRGQHFSYLGAGIGGSVTGTGATILIVDDAVKNAEEALNDDRLEKIWTWYTSTFLSRASAAGGEPLEIIVGTPWSKKDLGGKIKDSEHAGEYFVFTMPAYDPAADQMLCPDLLSKKRYIFLRGIMVPEIHAANYDMIRMDVKGKLYKTCKTWKPGDVPLDEDNTPLFEQIYNYTDTADQGDDYLCSINYGIYNREAYIVDILYTKDGQEITEPATAEFLAKADVNVARIESNNGGRAFARNVRRILRKKLKVTSVVIKWFHQSKNKKARIISNSAWVQEHIYYPHNWRAAYPDFYKDVTGYMKEGKKQADDGPDVLTGIAENSKKGYKW